MPYNQLLAEKLRIHLIPHGDAIEEKKMFGGLCFLYRGKMAIGIVKDELAVRVVSEKMEGELVKHNVRPMDFTKRPMKEFLYVTPENDHDLPHWINLGIEHAKSKLNKPS